MPHSHVSWATALVTACVTLSAVAPAGAADGVPGLEFVQPSTLSLNPDAGGTQTEPVTVWIRNSTSAPVTPSFTTQVENGDGQAATNLEVRPERGGSFPRVPAGQVIRVRIVVLGIQDAASLSGQLVASAPRAAPAALDLTIAPKPNFGNRGKELLIVPGFAGFLLVLVCWLIPYSGGRASLGDEITKADLDFSTGFASTLTLVTAFLATVISAGVLPEQTKWLSPGSYVALNVIFGALIACASLAYGAYQQQDDDGSHGFVGPFLFAAALTAWAAFGELATLWFLIWDINGADGFTQGGVALFQGILITAGLLMLLYFVVRVYQITKPSDKKTEITHQPRTGLLGPAQRGLL